VRDADYSAVTWRVALDEASLFVSCAECILISGPPKRREQGIRIAQDGDAADARDARAADRDIRVLRRLVARQGRRVNALLTAKDKAAITFVDRTRR